MPLIVDTIRAEGDLRGSGIITDVTSQATAATTTTLTNTSTHVRSFTGSTAGQIVRTPNATTLTVGQHYLIFNASTAQIIIQLFDGTLPFTLSPGGSVRMVLETNGTTAGVWRRQVSSSSPFQGTAPIMCGYGGNAVSGRFLEFITGNSSDVSPFIVIAPSTIVGMAAGCTASTTLTASIYKNGNFVTALGSVSLAAQSNNYVNTLNIQVTTGDLITARISSGSGNKPLLSIYIAGS